MKLLLEVDENELLAQDFGQYDEEQDAEEPEENAEMQRWLVAYFRALREALTIEQRAQMQIKKAGETFTVVRSFDADSSLAARVADHVLRFWSQDLTPPPAEVVKEHVTRLAERGKGNAFAVLTTALATISSSSPL